MNRRAWERTVRALAENGFRETTCLKEAMLIIPDGRMYSGHVYGQRVVDHRQPLEQYFSRTGKHINRYTNGFWKTALNKAKFILVEPENGDIIVGNRPTAAQEKIIQEAVKYGFTQHGF